MKISPQNYAKGLIGSLDNKTDLKVVAKKFWQILQKNKQYKDLPKILAELDTEYAKANDLVLAHVFSPTLLESKELKVIGERLKEKTGKETLVRNVVDESLAAGVMVKVGGKEIDLSLKNKVNRLKKQLVSKQVGK